MTEHENMEGKKGFDSIIQLIWLLKPSLHISPGLSSFCGRPVGAWASVTVNLFYYLWCLSHARGDLKTLSYDRMRFHVQLLISSSRQRDAEGGFPL